LGIEGLDLVGIERFKWWRRSCGRSEDAADVFYERLQILKGDLKVWILYSKDSVDVHGSRSGS